MRDRMEQVVTEPTAIKTRDSLMKCLKKALHLRGFFLSFSFDSSFFPPVISVGSARKDAFSAKKAVKLDFRKLKTLEFSTRSSAGSSKQSRFPPPPLPLPRPPLPSSFVREMVNLLF